MTTIAAPMCSGCKHFAYDAPRLVCAAYPGGIPDAIINSTVDHRQPYVGDRGIQFAPATADDARYADSLFATVGQAVEEAVALDPAVWGYSPNQPRKSDGKFGTGGGGRSAPSSGGAGTVGETPEGSESRQRLQGAKDAAIAADKAAYDAAGHKNVFTGKSTWVAADANQRIGSDLKAQAMNAIGADLDAAFPPDKLLHEAKALHHGMNVQINDVDGADTPGRLVADAMLGQWAAAAYDPRDSASVVIHRAVSEEFGTGFSPNIMRDMEERGSWQAGKTKAEGGLDLVTQDHHIDVVRAGVRSMYDHTQKRLDEMGVGDTVTVYRGVGRETHGTVDVDANPASSWSFDRKVASMFAQKEGTKHEYYEANGKPSDGTVYTMTVPRKRILAMPGSGIGCFEEAEVVLTRGTGDRALGEPGPGPVL